MTKFLAGAFLLLFSFTAAAQTPEDSVAFAGARWQITPLAAGAECRRAQIDMFGSRQTVSVVAYPARNFTTEIIQLDGKASPTSELGKAAGADAALNGSYFNMKTLAPVTFVLIDKQILGRTTPGETMRTNGVIALRDKRGRKMDILRCDTTQYSRIARRYRSALAAGPMLVRDGRSVEYDSEDSFYARRHPRTLIGKRADGTVVMAVIDGRFKGEADGATIAETAYIARQLGLVDALNLDGGGSSTLWTAQEGILNHPYDNKRFDHEGERGVPNCIVIRPSGGKRSAGEQKAGKAPIIIGRKHNTGNIKPERHRPSGGKRSAGNTNRTKPVKRPEPVQTAGLKSRKNSRSKQPIKNVSTRQSPPAPPRHTPGYEKSPGISGAFHIQSYCHLPTISSTRSTIMAGVTACRQR